jgi:hypothetical protein
MNLISRTYSALCLLAATAPAQQPAHGSPPSGPQPLLQIQHLLGDQYVGFQRSCLLLYADGHYHRELRRQEAIDQRPSGGWSEVQVFEDSVSAGELQKLRDTLGTEGFRKIHGTVGDSATVRERLVFTPRGVIPHDMINIVEASVAHADGPQTFEIFLGPAQHDRSLDPFLT